MSQDQTQHDKQALDAEMAELEAVATEVDQLDEIKDDLAGGFFFDNPNESDIREKIQWLIDELENERGCSDKLFDATERAMMLLADGVAAINALLQARTETAITCAENIRNDMEDFLNAGTLPEGPERTMTEGK
jgi:hypothetical protein